MKDWFRRKSFGWGWVPISVEGWIVTGILLVISYYLYKGLSVTNFLISLIPLMLIFAYVADKNMGEPLIFKRVKRM